MESSEFLKNEAVDLINSTLKERGSSKHWLSQKSGIPYNSIRPYLRKERPIKQIYLEKMLSVLGHENFFANKDYLKNQAS